jgi:xanthine phosphoribosyltransferase
MDLIDGKIMVSYKEYGTLLQSFTMRLRKEKPDGVYGIPRGGLPIAVHISHHLGIPLFLDIDQFASIFSEGKLLVVDDIADKGHTYLKFIDAVDSKNISYVTSSLFYKPCSVYEPNYIELEVPSDLWVVFPWEDISEKCEVNGTF